MQNFNPQTLLVEKSVEKIPKTQQILKKFPHLIPQIVEDLRERKEPSNFTLSKRTLALGEARGELLKPFPKISGALNLDDYIFNPISNCHLECTYCVLQSYLRNNPVLTVFVNWDSFFEAIQNFLRTAPQKKFRIGTGELSDSLALDNITELSKSFVPFFAEQPNGFLELKTKSDRIQHLQDLDHRGNTVISWSISAEKISKQEELKCSTIPERLSCARQVQSWGYPVGLHLDPLICFEGWEEAYEELFQKISTTLDPRRIAWVSVGSLRFDKELKEVATQRFPHTSIFAEDFIAAPDGKFRYFKTLRLKLYRKIWELLHEWSEDFPRYLCMEPAWMWEEVTKAPAPSSEFLEALFRRRLEGF